MQILSLDDLGTEKEIKLFGKTTALKVQRLKIIIIGLKSLGQEIAKHLIQQQPEEICLCDNQNAKSTEEMLRGFNGATLIEILAANHNEADFVNRLDRYDLIILADIMSLKLPIAISHYIRKRAQKKYTQGLIWTCTFGFSCLQFCDFGENFKIFDRDGEPPFPYQITGISNSMPGIVSLESSIPHSYTTGDWVTIYKVEGMHEVNGNEPRPIKVIDNNSFSIEDTTKFRAYISGGLVQQVKVPHRMKFNPIEKSICSPSFAKTQANCTIYSTLISILRCMDNSISLQENIILDQARGIYEELMGNQSISMDLFKTVLSQYDIERFPVVNFWGGISSLECIKFCGKYTPRNDHFIQFYQDISINDKGITERLSQMNVLLVGSGGTGCEILRQLARMGVCNEPDYKLTILDDDVVRKYTQLSHFWFKNNTLGKYKADIAKTEAQLIAPNMNIEIVKQKMGLQCEQVKNHEIIFQAINNQNARKLIVSQAIKYNKLLFDQSLNSLKTFTQVLLPGGTINVDESLRSVYAVEKETYKKFPYLPLHSVLWAKDIFENSFVGFVLDYHKYIQSPSEYLRLNEDNETANLKAHIIGRITKPGFNLTLDKVLSLSKELFDYHFDWRIKQLLIQYPENDIQSVWHGYKKPPTPTTFNSNDELHVAYVQITSLLISRIFNIDSHQVLKPEFVIDKLHQMNDQYWHLQDPQLPIDQPMEQKYLPQMLNLDEDHTRSLYVRCIHALTNLRSKNYNISPMQLYKVQKYALEINRSNPMMHSIIAGAMGIELYKLLYTNSKTTSMYLDLNKNVIEFS